MMMDQMANCGGWIATIAAIVTFAVVILGGAAATKYLFFADRAKGDLS